MYKIALLLPLALQLKFIHNFRPFIIVLELGVNGKVKVYQLWELKSVPPTLLAIVNQAFKAAIFSPPEG